MHINPFVSLYSWSLVFFLDLEHNDDLAFDSNFFIMGLFLLAYLFNFLSTMNLCDPTKQN
jgi:hypothetical protein